MKRGCAPEGLALHVSIDRHGLLQACRSCAFSLVCLSGKRFTDVWICNDCEAFWVNDIHTLVDCDGFEADTSHTVTPGCPACEPYEFPPEFIKRIVGYQGKTILDTPTQGQGHLDVPDED